MSRASFAVAFVALVALAPLAAAQPDLPGVSTTLVSEVRDPAQRIPVDAPFEMTIIVKYRWGAGAVPTGPTKIALAPDLVPSYASVELPRPVIELEMPVPPDNATGGEIVASAPLVVTLKPGAPAFARENVTIRATAERNGNLMAAAHTSPNMPIVPEFAAVANVTSPAEFFATGGGVARVPFVVRVVANAPAHLTFELPTKPEGSRVVVPAPIEVPAGESSTTVHVEIAMPWTSSSRSVLNFIASPASIKDETLLGEGGESETILVSASAIPAPGLLVAALGVALAAGLTRR
ncbi:MAG TPA: hypothetical protein VM889_14510 [Candidatus Thermoplasmatota archaeon]|nr:hypothetical protein [Candidatus Thermoplasmatota archaeon]